eukprot:CAMPEP_0197173202 /NCGR_PEP_ID=MMETSP1423-20130617/226_1 /TAXON_ID=476441 /ORGANISM="Pseudo-nitzschia heimii, Strain UNC1101" /LENGTH=408 /DNA_ID=CAMNT_0042621985 /DNA_START=102 /DNA_END=1328 /DNA_ORIENTATION=-
MKFSAVVISVALAASQTSAFMAPSPVTRAVRPVFSSEMAEETASTTTNTDDAPASPVSEEDIKNFEEKVAEETAAELNLAATAAAASAPAPVTAETYELKTVDKSKIIPGRYADEEFSVAVPFLKRPPKLDGTQAGDFGFDPLGFTEDFDLFTMQEAELRHGRLAMLAVIGWPMSELLAPSWMLQDGCAPSVLNGFNPLSAVSVLAALGALGFFEYKTALRRNDNTKFGTMHRADMADCVDGKYGVAGDYGFDPLNLYSSIGDDAYARKGLREVEISHGRSAMLGITAFAAWEAITGHPIVENSMFFHPNALLPSLVAAYYAFGYFYELDEETAGTFYRFRMSSEGNARMENLKMAIGMTSSGATPAPKDDDSQLDAVKDGASAFFKSIQSTYSNLEKSYLDNVVKKD